MTITGNVLGLVSSLSYYYCLSWNIMSSAPLLLPDVAKKSRKKEQHQVIMNIVMVCWFMCSGQLNTMLSATTLLPPEVSRSYRPDKVRSNKTPVRSWKEDQCALPLALSSLGNRPAAKITAPEENGGHVCVLQRVHHEETEPKVLFRERSLPLIYSRRVGK